MKIHGRLLAVILICILAIGFALRHYHYRITPRHGATFDEFAWTWLGINLIQNRVPKSWSPHPQYKNRTHLIYQGAAFWIVEPYLEHPPLFGLVAGSFSLLRGARNMYDVNLGTMRPLALLLGTFSILLIFVLSDKLYDRKTALLAGLLYASVPTVVIGSRILQNENFLIPCWLLGMLCIDRYVKTKKTRFRNMAAVIAGLLTLAKVPWIVAGLSFSLLLSYRKRWRDAVLVGLITLGIFSLYLLYGFYFDKELFINLWKLQTARYDIRFQGIFSLFTTPLLVDRYYLDGWIYFGWLSVSLLLREFKKHYMILIPLLSYLCMYLFAIPDEPSHGWYRYPFYPLLIIGISYVLIRELKEGTMLRLLFILIVGLSLMTNVWQTVFGFSLTAYRVFLVSAFFSTFLPYWFPKYHRLSNILLVLWISLFILGNLSAVMHFTDY